MAFSDARNERDRADTGRNSGNHGGRDNAGAERRNREAMGLGVGHQFDSRMRNSRYQQNQIATRPATLGNIAQAVSMGMPGPGMIAKGAAMIGGYDPFSGGIGRTTGFSYDGPNRFATGANNAFRPKMPGATMSGNQARAQALSPSNPVQAPDWWRIPF